MTNRPRAGRTLLACLCALLVASCGDSTAPPKATTIQLNALTATLDALTATTRLNAVVLDQKGNAISGATVTWLSLNPGIATVDATGLVTAVANGQAQVTATSGTATASANVTVAQRPIAPTVLGGNGQSGVIGLPLAQPIQARVEDRLGSPMAGVPVQFVVTSGSGSVGTPTVTSDAAGLASTTWTLGTNTAVAQLVSVSVVGGSTFSTFTATALAGPATALEFAPVNPGNNQVAPLGTNVPIRPAVKLRDALGNGVAGAAVTFAVTGGGGSVTGATATTDATGIATVGNWTLGPATGANTLTATASGFPPVTFTATAILDPCTAAGAPLIALGDTINGSLVSADCTAGEATNYDLYKFVLASQTIVIINMASTSIDSYLKVLDATTGTLLAENDDIVLGVIQDSRIVDTLAAGSYLIRARSFDPGQFGPYTLSLIAAVPGVPAAIALNAGSAQVVAPNTSVPIAPSVTVRDALGNPVAGAQVTFEIVPTVGSITGAVATTNASGIATVGSWTLAAGANVMSATVTGSGVTGNPVMFSASGNASTGGFNIDLKFQALPTLVQLQAFRSAASRWETIITNDLAAQPINIAPGTCSGPGMNETVEDLAIIVLLAPIDGQGGILGSAGPCILRGGSTGLTALGVMRFDAADLPALEANGSFNTVILHEMGHVLGIGTLWSRTGLLLNPSLPSSPGVDTRFTGVNSVAGFDAIGGTTYTLGGKVPVENSQGGAGTRDSHWRESVLQNELMTGFLGSGVTPLSMLTVRSLQDIGYTVNTGAADPFFLSLSLRAEGATPAGFWLGDDIWHGPVHQVDSRGRIIGGASLRQK
ncbi:MAG: Ig-like domain-containing protein [Gemmatimonadota bacterium]|nr:Ig-like domain-containing protein [Gemmatimonadota bacterium]